MSEKFSPVPNDSANENHEHQDIPLFNRLDKESQAFVLEVKMLSELTDEELLAKYPEIEKLRDARALRDKEEWEPFANVGLAKWVWRDIINIFRVNPPHEVWDKKRFIGTMWDIVRIYLLELEDSLKHPGVNSKQTDYLAEKLIRNIYKTGAWGALPELYAKEPVLPEDTSKKIAYINFVLNLYHQHVIPGEYPAGFNLISDLWRYIIINMKSPMYYNLDNWNKTGQEFMTKLGNIRLSEQSK